MLSSSPGLPNNHNDDDIHDDDDDILDDYDIHDDVNDIHGQGCISCGILVSGIQARGVS